MSYRTRKVLSAILGLTLLFVTIQLRGPVGDEIQHTGPQSCAWLEENVNDAEVVSFFRDDVLCTSEPAPVLSILNVVYDKVGLGSERERFLKAVSITLNFEGGYTDHPNDKGGATKFGITQGTLNAAFKLGYVSHNNIKKLTKEEAMTIYYKKYWLPAKCHLMPSPIDIVHFDTVVNSGIGGGSMNLQRTINSLMLSSISVDGALGSISMEKFNQMSSFYKPHVIAKVYLFERSKLFTRIAQRSPSQRVFLRGWLNRVVSLSDKLDL